MEKDLENVQLTSNNRKTARISWISTALVSFLGLSWLAACQYKSLAKMSSPIDFSVICEDLCPASSKLVPSGDGDYHELDYFRSPEYQNYSLGVWGDAVRVASPSFDDLGKIGEDPRWDVFYKFEKYLLKTFPTVKEHAELVHVNTHGLVFIIHGTDETLKPIMLTGHQDVVPVPEETISRWTYPPFEGHFDGEFLWGRGSADCKNTVTAIFEALEGLLTQGYKPKRSVVVALGFDEECSGFQGASSISKYLEDRFGKNGIQLIIDEGGLGIQDDFGARLALPGTGEKGYVDVTIDLLTSGGHSSVPPFHTGIGLMADLIHEIESTTYQSRIITENPFFHTLQCQAKVGKTMDDQKRSDIQHLTTNSKALERVIAEVNKDPTTRYLITTSQAVDIITGGLKINALPEKVTVRINHRVAYGSSVDEVKDRITKLTKKIAELYDLGVQGFDVQTEEFSDMPTGYFKLSSAQELSPAPVTPTTGSPSWDLITGTIRNVFEDFAIFPDADKSVPSDVTVSPCVMTGNTDTRYYWALTPNIFRFTPIRQNRRLNAHAIDERVGLDAHIEVVAFYYQLLRNAEQYGEQLGL